MARIFLRNLRTFFLAQQEIKSIQLSKYCSGAHKPEKSDIDYPSTTYIDTSPQYAIGKKSATQQLQQLLDLDAYAANQIATDCKSLCLVTAKTITSNYKTLKDEGINDSVILAYPNILGLKDMTERIAMLKSLNYEFKDTVPLLSLNMDKLLYLVNKFLYNDTHLQRMAELFQATLTETCGFLVKRQFLQNISLRKLENNLKLLTGFGITHAEIKNDFWVLQYSTIAITDRLKLAEELNIDKLKTWMVRSSPKIFNKHVQRIYENKHILGENSIDKYLSQRLECSPEEANFILSKHSALLTKSLRKMNEIIDFLISKGFTAQHILRNSKILLHSVETTKKRLNELESQGIKVDSLYIFTKSQKEFDNLVKSNKSKIKDAN